MARKPKKPSPHGTPTSMTVPSWVPAGATHRVEFNNNRAWTLAAGEVDIDTLLGNDPTTENGFGGTEYNPANLTADGLVNPAASRPAFIGSLRDKVFGSGGGTFVVRFKGELASAGVLLAGSEDGENALMIMMFQSGWAQVESRFDSGIYHEFPDVLNTGVGADNCVAFTIVPGASGRIDVAVNGSAPYSANFNSTSWPSGAGELVCFIADPAAGGTPAMASITAYDALPGLSALSV